MNLVTIVEPRLGSSAKSYLAFGKTDKQIKVADFASKYQFGKPVDMKTYYGEFNANSQPHGRAIALDAKGNAYFGSFQNGLPASGNFLNVFADGWFEAGQYYNNTSTGKLMQRGTRYFKDGSS